MDVNRSTYYKHFNSPPSDRTKENQEIAKAVLQIYADSSKRLGVYKITYILQRDYGIHISVGRVYHLIKYLQLPKMSTDRPRRRRMPSDNISCSNHLSQKFNQKAPNLVWVSDITYLNAGGKWYYLCVIMDLFSRKIISWNISGKPDAKLFIAAFKSAYNKWNSFNVPFRQRVSVYLFSSFQAAVGFS